MAEPWDDPVPHVATDLSLHGIWLETPFPLPLGTRVALSFTPPRWRRDRDIVVFAEVRRVEHGRTDGTSGMGLEILDLEHDRTDELCATLFGLPPPLPRGKRTTRHEYVWVDMLLTWEEDLGDRVNTFEVSEAFATLCADELDIEPLAAPLGSAVAA
jgi:hypothetical protein